MPRYGDDWDGQSVTGSWSTAIGRSAQASAAKDTPSAKFKRTFTAPKAESRPEGEWSGMFDDPKVRVTGDAGSGGGGSTTAKISTKVPFPAPTSSVYLKKASAVPEKGKAAQPAADDDDDDD